MSRRSLPVLLLLFVGSGAAALMYEVIWFQLLQVIIGSSAVSLAVLLGTFMGGLCLGSWLFPRLSRRWWHPLRVYAALELGIGAEALLLVWLMPLVNDAYRSPEQLEALDEVAEAFLLNAVANRASRIQGRTLLGTAGRIWPSAALAALQARVEATCAHVAPVAGAAFCAIGLPLPTVQRVLLYGAARGVLSAAVRLGLPRT